LVRHRSTDLDCRVVATSRRVASTECDSRLPLFGRRGSTCRLRLLDSWPPGDVWRQWYSTRVARLDSCVATCRPDRVRLVRQTSHVGCGPTRPTRPTRRTKMSRRGATRQTSRRSKVRSTRRLVRLLGLCRTKMSRRGATRQTSRRSKVRSTRRLVRLLGLCRTKMSRRGATRQR
jgi:hypothetical protein